jgi:hypothetical protein
VNFVEEQYDPDKADVFVDNLMGKGPKSQYNEETIPRNSQIQQFIFKYYRIYVHVKEAGVTISGNKFVAATPELEMLGTTISLHGVTHGIVSKIAKWPICTSTRLPRNSRSHVKWIKGFAKITCPLVLLTKKTETSIFEWSDEA